LWEHNREVTTHSFYLFETSGRFVNGYVEYDLDKVKTFIGNDVWVAANSVILKGISVGNGAIIGAGAVVTKDVPPYAIVVGNPARVIKYRFDQETVEFLQKTEWWNLSRATLQEMVDHKVFFSMERFKKFVEQRALNERTG
jgi:tetrahydrodipicolinate N-succinyltransferase